MGRSGKTRREKRWKNRRKKAEERKKKERVYGLARKSGGSGGDRDELERHEAKGERE